MTPEIQIEGAAIEAKYPDLMDPKATYESADAYVIALAKLNGGIVISQETSHRKNASRRRIITFPMSAVTWAYLASICSV